jgi:hypothetical protein
MCSVTPDQARDFYRAAATFYRQAPWHSVGADEPIKVKCEPLEAGPRFAIVLGKKGQVKGLWLCDDWKTCLLVEQGDYRAVAEHLGYMALHFWGHTEVSPNDLEEIQRLGFEVAGPKAYPSVLRKEPGGEFRSPDVYEYAFQGEEGKMSLDLSWVPKERLSVDRPEKSS